jgi:endonuclease V-like protein UPF0215 family
MKSIANVKREIRILGLDTCNPKLTIGAIVRGGLYLDGILAFSNTISSGTLAREIAETKYFPELRMAMVHDPDGSLNSRMIRQITRLPLVHVPLVNSKSVRGGISTAPRHYNQPSPARPDPAILARILEITHVRGYLPEPVRIAHLLSKLHVFGRHWQDKR